MLAAILGFIGLILGIAVLSDSDVGWFAGGGLGAVIGAMLGLVLRVLKQQKELTATVQQLQSELRALRGSAAPPAVQPTRTVALAASMPVAAPAPVREEELPLRAPELAMEAAEALPPAAAAAPSPMPPSAAPDLGPDPLEQFLLRGFNAARGWLLGGNTMARVGIVVLFLGLAFALQLAAQFDLIPIELWYAAVAAVGLVILAIGWRLRERQRTYGLLMQGLAVAVLYLTISAAMRLHPLLPPSVGFPLLVAIVVFSAILAVAQDSLALAVAGAAGGFAAPILTATGGEHHVALFSYYALLNAGILAVAWFKAWRPLNLVGFGATLVIGFAWGIGDYQPEMFATTEPFLLLFFLMYVVIAFLFARRVLADAKTEPPATDRLAVVKWAAEQSNYLDGILLFGAPVIGFGLQYALIRHLPYGTAFSALGLGLFYMLLALVLLRRTQWRYVALVEAYVALGAIFATLAVPLGLDARWTAAAWAVEGAGVYWIGVKQNRRLSRGFALLVQAGAAASYLSTLAYSGETRLILGSALGALMLGASLLFSYWQLHGVAAAERRAEDKPALIGLAAGGLAFLYLLAPLFFLADGTAIAWAAGGIATIYLGMRLADRSWIITALAIQGLGGLLFLMHLPTAAEDSGAVLATGWRGLLVAGVVGGAALASFALVRRDLQAKADPVVMRGLSLLLLFGLIFVNLAVLFVLPWSLAGGVWAASGVVILLLSLQLQQRLSFAFALALQVIGGGAFVFGAYPALEELSPAGLTPLWHSGFWTPVAIALAAYIGAWLLFRAERDQAKTLAAPLDDATLSLALLAWATVWWAFAWLSETFRFLPEEARPHAMLLVTAASVIVWMLAAELWQWRAMAALCGLSIPAALFALLLAVQPYYDPAAHLGVVAWPALLVAHLVVLRRVAALMPEKWPNLLHIVGCWVFLGVAALEMRYAFIALSDNFNAWRWLGWASVPALYLLVMAQERVPAFWPFTAYEREYRAVAALPVAIILLAWFWLSNIVSDGAAAPLPYIPLLNPLELGQLFALFALLIWLRTRFPMLPWAGALPAAAPYWLVGASALFLLTCGVARMAHHWFGIPYEIEPLFAAMLVQAGLSIIWGVAALAAMVAGHLRQQRDLWIVGAALVAVVVVKMFLIELFNAGGLPRIVSFIGVGVLLLIIGYFAPLPPKRADRFEEVAR
jgi:uncharacterized membrane protein